MRTITVRRVAFVLIIAGVVAASFGVAYSLSAQDPDTPGPDDEPQPGGLSREDLEALRDADQAKPRFTGELLGFQIFGLNDEVPEEYITKCEKSERVPDEQAGIYALNVEIPKPYIYQPEHINSGVLACDGRVVSARWNYAYPQAYPGQLWIGRSADRYTKADFSTDRVSTQVLGGRDAIVLAPIRKDGMNPVSNDIWGSDTLVVFPEPFGSTRIMTRGIPFEEVLRIAALVGEATK